MALNSWIDYYRNTIGLEQDGIAIGDWDEGLLDLTDRVIRSTDDPEKLTQEVEEAEEESNMVIILPGKGKTIRSMHSCYVANNKLWGIQGIQATAAIQEAPKSKLCESINVTRDFHTNVHDDYTETS
ncbi:MAG: hypothetical protein SGILL_005922, partial [Bacillariaceae sp.]